MPHTQGPWTCSVEPASPASYDVYDENGNYLEGNLKVREANAALIAASPELLEALKEALDHAQECAKGCIYCGADVLVDGAHKPEHEKECWYYKAEALIAKAEGR